MKDQTEGQGGGRAGNPGQAETKAASVTGEGTNADKREYTISPRLHALQLLQPSVITLVTVLFLGLLIWGVLGKRQIVSQLARVDYARGLITYILAVGTMAIAVVVTVGALLGKDEENAEKRFNRGKEILTILIGVLGTIVGFYYGSQAEAGMSAEQLRVAAPLLSRKTPEVGDTVTLTSLLTGGTRPYGYTLTFGPKDLFKPREGVAREGGWIVEAFIMPESAAGLTLEYAIEVTDAAGQAESYQSDKRTSIAVKAGKDNSP